MLKLTTISLGMLTLYIDKKRYVDITKNLNFATITEH